MSKLGESTFCMPLEGEMLNLLQQNSATCFPGATSLAVGDAFNDITPPTVFVGNHEAIHIPMSLKGVCTLHIIFIIDM